MSARVFKPISLSEIPKIKNVALSEGKLMYKGISKVRRVLFNPNPEETQRFLKEEFAKMSTTECSRWNFDFLTGKPLNGKGQFEWSRITEPSVNAAIKPAKRLSSALIQDNSQDLLYAPIQTSANYNDNQLEQMSIDSPSPRKDAFLSKKQSLITDFMQARKRIEDRTTKKLDSDSSPRPQKMPRLSLMDSTS